LPFYSGIDQQFHLPLYALFGPRKKPGLKKEKEIGSKKEIFYAPFLYEFTCLE